MKNSLLQILACPFCKEPLAFEGTSVSNRLVKGVLRCAKNHLYQVKDEIPLIKDPSLSRREFVWKVTFPNLGKYEEIQRQYRSYLSEEQKEADKALMNELAKTVVNERLVLDVASGMGFLLLVLSQLLGEKCSLLGTDVDETPLRGAKLKLQEQRSYQKVSLCVMDGKHLALKPRKIPCVSSWFGLDNIPEPKKALEEASRVLMSTGRLVLATLWLEETSRSLALAEELGFGGIATKDRLNRTLKETGFKIDSARMFYSGKWPRNPMDRLPLEGDWFAHSMVIAQKT
jgi:uncharacterized protein YbaR (Trm112 family)